jgi:dTDP-4-dehydrorhamnose 3,5-epimerase
LELKRDCRSFRGDVPCKPHKLYGVHCVDKNGHSCQYYEKIDKRILIIKIGAVGRLLNTR